MCFNEYITIDPSTPSRSGRYAVNLPGVSLSLLDALTTDEQDDYEQLWSVIYDRAKDNLVTDVSKMMMNKFHVDLKLVTRETSEFKDSANTSLEDAGLLISFKLPKYAKLHIISVDVKSLSEYSSPGFELNFYNGDNLVYSKEQSISEGLNTVNIDRDFEVDSLLISYDPAMFDLYSTKNKYFRNDTYSDTICEIECYGCVGSVKQVKGGGLNVKFVIHCSIEKFVCENINLFGKAFWFKIGEEIAIERRLGETLSRYTTLTIERAEEITSFFSAQYSKELSAVISGYNYNEDPFCFVCKNSVSSKTFLP